MELRERAGPKDDGGGEKTDASANEEELQAEKYQESFVGHGAKSKTK